MEVKTCYGEMNMTIINESMKNSKYMESCKLDKLKFTFYKC